MKKLLLALSCVVVCTSALAQPAAPRRFAKPELIDLKLNPTELFRQATGPRAAVSSEGPDNAFLFAVAGSTSAAGGLYFRSEVTLVNNDTIFSQNVAVIYFPSNGGSCSTATSQALRLSPNTFYVWPDFVNTIFHTSGLGSIVVVAVDSNGNFDSTGNIDGFSRIWTPIPGYQGTASQSFPSVAIGGYPGVQYIYGLQHDGAFRTNVFIFNYLPTGSSAPRTFAINVVGLSGNTSSLSLSVGPCSLGVLSLNPNVNFGATSMAVVPPDSAGGWFAFGSTVDNLSGDNWSVAGRPDLIH